MMEITCDKTVTRAVQTVQTGQDEEGLQEEGLVQISSSLHERISSFQRYKRFQLDVCNQVEFCGSCESTCARTDMAHFRRSTKLRKIHAEKGPLGKPLLPLEQFQRSLLHEQTSVWDNRCAANTALHLPKRISNIENYLGMNQGGTGPKDLLTRVAQLEVRLLAVEGRSYEYNHAKVGNKSVPLPTINK